jgi:hypothetical protein
MFSFRWQLNGSVSTPGVEGSVNGEVMSETVQLSMNGRKVDVGEKEMG